MCATERGESPIDIRAATELQDSLPGFTAATCEDPGGEGKTYG